MKRVEWMKGICHIWSRGRLISPSLPVGDDWHLNLRTKATSGPKSRGASLGRTLWHHASLGPGDRDNRVANIKYMIRGRHKLLLNRVHNVFHS